MKYGIKDAKADYPELMGKTLAIIKETGTYMIHVTNILRVTIGGKYDEIIFAGDTENFEVPLYLTDYLAYYLATRFYIYDCGTFIAVYEDEPKDEREQLAKEYAKEHNQRHSQNADWRYSAILN